MNMNIDSIINSINSYSGYFSTRTRNHSTDFGMYHVGDIEKRKIINKLKELDKEIYDDLTKLQRIYFKYR